MRNITQTEFSDCCGEFVALLEADYFMPPGLKEIFYFKCSKCKKPCHLKKKIKHDNVKKDKKHEVHKHKRTTPVQK